VYNAPREDDPAGGLRQQLADRIGIRLVAEPQHDEQKLLLQFAEVDVGRAI
jgi:hypothetical protein